MLLQKIWYVGWAMVQFIPVHFQITKNNFSYTMKRRVGLEGLDTQEKAYMVLIIIMSDI